MKKILFLFLLTVGFCKAQIVTIPDANFKAKLIQLGVDTNSDGSIQQSEALAVTQLSVNESNILSMEGIQSFANLVFLECYYNHDLAILDVTNLHSLEYLDTRGCALTALNVSGLTNLKTLTCWQNQLTSIDISSLASLEELMVDQNQLTSINANGLTNLKKFNFSSNQITNVDLSNVPNVQMLDCRFNQISSLDLSAVPNLYSLYCESNNISSLDFSSVPNLVNLRCQSNQLSSLDISSLHLTHLYFDNNQISSINLLGQTSLFEFSCSNNGMSQIDFTGLTALEYVLCENNLFTHLDLSNQPHLWVIACDNNLNLTSINMKNGTAELGLGFSGLPNLQYICADDVDFAGIQVKLNEFGYTNCVFNSYCTFTPGGEHNTITGNVKFDANNDGCGDTDLPKSNVKIKITNTSIQGSVFSNTLGNYTLYTLNGNFVLTPSFENPAWFAISPATANVNFSNTNNNTFTQNFCVAPVGIHNDVEIIIAPLMPARPGFDATYQVIYKNKGNQSISGIVQFNFEDDVLDYVSSTQTPDVQNGGSLIWNYANLLPFEVRTFTVVLNVNSPTETPAVNIGDLLNFSATISSVSSDEIPFDNTFDFRQIVVGSFDPNDKTCLEGTLVSVSKIGDYLHYSINFENTGTFPASFVVVRDAINTTKFDIATVQVISASHPIQSRVVGNKVEFIFEDINLGPNQHGNVTFKVKTKSTLVAGNTVTNNASIYFDYNFPIVTNTASTTFQTLSSDEFTLDNSVAIAPNPVKDHIKVNCNSTIQSIQFFDVQGRILTTQIANDSQSVLDVSKYSNGIYFVKVITEKGSKVEKIIKE